MTSKQRWNYLCCTKVFDRNNKYWIPGQIARLCKEPRSYIVKTAYGDFWRNRRELRDTGLGIDRQNEQTIQMETPARLPDNIDNHPADPTSSKKQITDNTNPMEHATRVDSRKEIINAPPDINTETQNNSLTHEKCLTLTPKRKQD